MILRRFTQHLKEQNWFAVGLDVIVVIVGIFLGMQVTEWNEERKDIEIGQSYIKSIAYDIASDATQLERKVSQWRYSSERIKEYSRFLSSGANSNLSNWDIYEGMYSIAGFSPFRPNRRTYDELISTGQFRLINDAKVRRAISEYYNTLEESKPFYDFDTPTRQLTRQAYSPDAQDYLWSVCFSVEQYRNTAGGGTECEQKISDTEISATLQKLRDTEGLLEAYQFVNSTLIINMNAGEIDKENARELSNSLQSLVAE